jgi:AbrB family looped-hinge helix DNA binding protein
VANSVIALNATHKVRSTKHLAGVCLVLGYAGTMRTTTVSSKGQVTIPAALLRELHLEPGTQLLVVPVRDGVMLVRRPESAADALAGSVRDVYGDPRKYVDAKRT